MGKQKDKVKEQSIDTAEMNIPITDGDIEDSDDTQKTEIAPEVDTVEVELDPLEQIKELEDQKLRLMAEMENYRKRMARQFQDIVKSANDRLLMEIVEIIDNFDRALKHADEKSEADDPKSFSEGIDLIFNQMNDMLSKNDVKPIDAVGQTFDPELHEALMQVDSDDFDEGVVALEINRGYKIGDRVLRHSKVGVSQGKKQTQENEKNK